MRKNILVVLDTINRGGTEVLMHTVLSNIDQSKNKYHFAYFHSGAMEEAFELLDIPIYFLPRKKKIDFSLILNLNKVINSNKIDVVISNQHIDLFHLVLTKILFFKRKLEILRFIHGYITISKFWIKLETLFLSKFVKKNYPVSNELCSILGKKGYNLQNLETFYNCVDFKDFENIESNYFKKKYNIKEKHFLIGMVGNFTKVKDQLTLIKAITIARKKRPNIRCIFVGRKSAEDGSSSLYDICNNFVKDSNLEGVVFFEGASLKVKEFLSEIDLFVFATKFETFGIAAVEALAMRTPVLSSDIGVLKEVLGSIENVHFYKQENEVDLVNQIVELYDLWEEKSLGKINNQQYEFIKSKYDVTTYIKKLDSIL